MPKVIIDTSNVPDGEFSSYDGPVPPPALYKVVFKKAWWTKSSTNKPMLKVLFELQTDNEKKKQFNGYVIWHNITNEASTAWKMKELFKALGTGLKSGIDFDEQGIVTRIGSAVPGKTELLVKGKYGTYQGQAKLEVDTLSPLPNRQTEEYAGDMDEEATSYEETFEPAPQEDSFAGEEWDSPADDDLGGEPPF